MAGKKCGASHIAATKKCTKGSSRKQSSGSGSLLSSTSRIALLAAGVGATAAIASNIKQKPKRPKFTNSGKKMTPSMEAKLKKMQGLKHGTYEKYKISSTKSVQMPYYSPTSDLRNPARRMFRADKKCGNSGIPENAKCTKSTAQSAQKAGSKSGSGLATFAAAAALAGGGAAALGAMANRSKAGTSGSKGFGKYKAPSIPKKKISSIRKRLEEIKRKNKENPGRSEIRDLRALGKKAERQVGKGMKPHRAIQYASKVNLYKKDELTREDKKCGQSGIPDNAKCTKQTAPGQPQKPKTASNKSGGGLNVGRMLTSAAVAGAFAYASSEISQRQANAASAKRTLKRIKDIKAKGNDSLLASLKAAKNASDLSKTEAFKGQKEHMIGQAKQRIYEGISTRNYARAQAKQGIAALKSVVPQSEARKRKANYKPKSVTGGLARRSRGGGLARRS